MGFDAWDGLDRQLVEALALAARVPFSRLGQVLSVSDQTVARRYQRLRERAGLRVIGHLASQFTGAVDWHLRLQCTPDAAGGVGEALASRPDCRWVQLCSGGTEVSCVVTAEPGDSGPVLLDRLVGGRKLVGISAHALLHDFSSTVIPALAGHLSPDQRAALSRAGDVRPPATHVVLDEVDHAIIAALGLDGRTSAADLAVAASSHESTVRRRLEQLQQSGSLVFDIDVDSSFAGRSMHAILWLSVVPTELDRVGTSLAGDPRVAFVAATTGPSNLMASVLTNDAEDLYRFLSQRIGTQHEILRVETAPVMRTLKRHGHLIPA